MLKLYQDQEQFIKDMFWEETRDPSSKLNIPQLIEEKLIKDNKEKDPEYYNHREGVVHTTSLTKCLRGVVHEMLGAKKDGELSAQKLGVFKAGNLFEDFVIEALKDYVVHTQREYEYYHKGIIVVGRSDYTILDNGVLRIGENKSVHSDSFWMREREGTLVAAHNQVQLESYLWFERILTPYKCPVCGKVVLSNRVPVCPCTRYDPREHGRNMESIYTEKESYLGREMIEAPEEKLVDPQGVFSYISKDDCTVIGAPVKYNHKFVDEIIIPTLDLINEAYEKKDPNICPEPPLAVYSEAKGQWQVNWIAKYCDYHSKCAGAGWLLEAQALVTKKNKELRAGFAETIKKVKPKVFVEESETQEKVVSEEENKKE